MNIRRLWVVRDPSPVSELGDIMYEVTVARLPEYVIGTGAERWRAEHTTFYTDEAEARADAEARLKTLLSV